jgi:hypothetical protein
VFEILAPEVGLEMMWKLDFHKNTNNDLKRRLIVPIWYKMVFLFIKSNSKPNVHCSKKFGVY